MPANAFTATVRKTPAGPVLLLNGQPAPPVMFFTNTDVQRTIDLQLKEIELAGRHGVNLLSVTMWVPWPEPGQAPSFGGIDARIRSVLKANPGALLIPRTGVTWPPAWWKEAHPDELMLFDDGTRGIASVHSRLWREEAARHYRALIQHLEAEFGDSIAGYHPTGQNTGEWFYDGLWDRKLSSYEEPAREAFRQFLRAKYGSDEGLRRAWHDPDAAIELVEPPSVRDRTRATAGSFRDPLIEQHVIDFYEFTNIEMADAALTFARVIREAAPDKLSVHFYGYHFEVSNAPFGLQSSGHLAMRRVLDSPDVDILCSPVSYLDRMSGGGGYLMAAVDSVHLAGKMWLIEDDTRTHLGEQDPVYQMQHLADARETNGVLARNFAHVLTRGGAVWWMDLFGRGWFSDEQLWTLLEKLKDASQVGLSTRQRYSPEIAFILDDNSALYAHPSAQLTWPVLGESRKQFYRIGAPVGIYMLDDLTSGRVPPARMYIFADAYRLDPEQIAAVRRVTGRKGCVSVWMYGQGVIGADGRPALANVENTTGISVVEGAPGSGGELVIEGSGQKADGRGPLIPHAVTDPEARVLVRYSATGEAAVAAKVTGASTSVYSGVLQLPSGLLRDLAREAGVHIYCDTDDVIAAGGGFVSIAASSDGLKTLTLPAECSLVDIVSGEKLGPARSFEMEMRKGDTRIFRMEN